MMKSLTTQVTVEWRDCDPAGIVYYPNFLSFFDKGTWNLFYSVGLTLELMQQEYDVVGFPLVDCQASFVTPARPKDELTLISNMDKIQNKTFTISHILTKGETVVAKGQEIRIWGRRHSEDPSRLTALVIPEKVTALFRA